MPKLKGEQLWVWLEDPAYLPEFNSHILYLSRNKVVNYCLL